MVPLFLILVGFFNAFNDHFSTIGPRLANEIPPNDNNNELSYINNINVNNNKFSFSSAI